MDAAGGAGSSKHGLASRNTLKYHHKGINMTTEAETFAARETALQVL